ncbi:MAG: DNA recombination protein RmuC [Clostridia bacterium]|nr:DNA recombination protein RmuC [Clostridia bacterium]
MGIYILLGLVFAAIIVVIVLQLFQRNGQNISAAKKEITDEVKSSMKLFSDVLSSSQEQFTKMQDSRMQALATQITENTKLNEQKLENMRQAVQLSLKNIQDDNSKKLEQMRQTVDEKLQKTLETRIGESFKIVSERLEQVYKGLGEMQSLASSVGDLKKTLSNVKTRGVLGEIQLGAILEEILSPEQYDKNVCTKQGTQNFVEFAVKLPGDGDLPVYLPIDAKFPTDAYANLVNAYDSGVQTEIESAKKILERRIKDFAKDIHEKYVSPPDTTDFAIMFLPTEGLYAEAVKNGITENVQRQFNVVITGPTNMAALLNSLQMGFKTLAIQKRSGEVWAVLGAVKTEFDKFGDVLQAAQNKIEMANSELDKLVGVRTRQIQRKLKSVTAMPESETNSILLTDGETDL